MSKKIFITGTESFVGSELIRQCDALGYALDGCDAGEPSDNRFQQCDIRSAEVAERIPEGVDAVVHLAALSTDNLCRDRAHDCFDVNVMGTLNLINAAVQKQAKQFIFASSEWVYDNFTNDELKTEDSVINLANLTSEYALSKLVSEANLRQKFQHGFCATTVLRFGIIYGTRTKNWSAVESIFSTVKNAESVTVGSLATGRYFVHVSDIVCGIIKSIGLSGFNIINLEGKDLVTLGDVIKTGCQILGKEIEVIENAPEDISVRNVSGQKAENIIGWLPKVRLEDGLRDLNKIL